MSTIESKFKNGKFISSSASPLKFGVAAEPVPADFLKAVSDLFELMGVVDRAACLLMDNEGETSYLIVMDLLVAPENIDNAMREIIRTIQSHSKVPYSGKWSLDFGVWDQRFQDVVVQLPELEFFRKK